MEALRERAKHMATHSLIFQRIMDEWIQQYPELYRDFLEWAPISIWSTEALGNAYYALGSADAVATILEAAKDPRATSSVKIRMMIRIAWDARTEVVTELLLKLDSKYVRHLADCLLMSNNRKDIKALVPYIMDVFSPNIQSVYKVARSGWVEAFNELLPITPDSLLASWENYYLYCLVTPEREDLWEALRSANMQYMAHVMRLPRGLRWRVVEVLFQVVGCPSNEMVLVVPSTWANFLTAIRPEHHPALAAAIGW